MKIAAVGMLLGAMLAGSAQAAESGVPAAPLLSNESVQAAPSPTKKSKSLQSRKAKSSGKAGATKAGPKAKQKQDSVTETPAESTDQSVQLKGVRG